MKIVDSVVNRPITTYMIYAFMAVLGAVAIPKIPLEFMPQMDAPFIEIHIPYEGASPVEVCEQIAEPIEEAIAVLPGIKKVHSRCRPGYVYVGIELSPSAKMDYMVLDVQERIDAIREDLPSDLRNMMINKFDTEQIPIIMGAITFPEDRPENNDLLDRFVLRPLKTVDGVAAVNVEGLEERRVLVEMDENKLTRYGVNIIQVFDALISANSTLSAGSVSYAELKHNVRIVGEFKDVEEIKSLPVTDKVRIRDVAEVKVEYVRPFFIGRLNKDRAYILMVLKESDANVVDVSQEVKRKIGELLENPMLKGVQLKVWFDQSREILTSIDILRQNGVEGAALAFIVLLIFLKNFRATSIIAFAIPTSILITITGMYFIGLSFNIITLSSLILGVGMLVDNAIVVLEAIDLRHRGGLSAVDAAREGSKEVGLAITASTSTTIIVFLPLIFTEQTQSSILMKQFGGVLSLSITSSLVVSLTLIPLLASRFLKETATHDLPRWYVRLSSFFEWLLRLGLARRRTTVAIMTTFFIGALLIFFWPMPWTGIWTSRDLNPPDPLIEKEAVPQALIRMVRFSVKFEHKPPLAEIDARMTELEDLFMSKKDEWDLDTVAAIVSEQFTRILLVLPDDRMPKYTAKEIEEMGKALLKENINWAGITIESADDQMGGPPGMRGSTSIKVRGPDAGQVYSFAEQIRKRLLPVPGLKEIKPIERTGEEELHVMVDRDLARQYGFETSQIAMAISYAVRGVPVGQIHFGDSPLDIFIQVRDAEHKNLAQLRSMNIQNLRGQFIPLNNFSDFKLIPIPQMIVRDNRLNTVRIPIVPKGKDLRQLSVEINQALQNFKLPMGYSWVLGEEFEDATGDLKTIGLAIILAMALVLIIMTAQFESFFLPFIIMFELPFTMIGVVLGLFLTGSTFNVLSGTGCLLLVGVVVNNAIVLVDHVNNLRKKGYSQRESLIQGSKDRLRPIMMTALTTIMGLLPMALGSNDTGRMMYSPLAIAVLGGLAASTFLTPFVIPVIYSMFDGLIVRLRRVWDQFREA